MKARGKFIVIILIVVILGTFIQMTRLNIDMNYRSNLEVTEENDSGEKLDIELLNSISINKVLVVSRDIDDSLDRVLENITRTLAYMQKDYDVIQANKFEDIDVDKYSNIIFNIYSLSEVKDVEKIKDFAKEGGSIFFSTRLDDNDSLKKLYSVIGIENIEEEVETRGIKLVSNLMIKGNGTEIEDDIRLDNLSNKVKVSEDAIIHITDGNNLPLLWEKDYEDGKVFYFNGTMFAEKTNRGVLAAIFSKLNDIDVYPIMNTKLSFIDDFPSPVPSGTSDEIFNEYGVSIRRFYKEIWWPDMLKTASNNNMKYTGVIIGTYDDETKDLSKSDIDIENSDFSYYAREILSINGELGIHGYNHQPLILYDLKDQTLGYKAWRDKETMKEGIKRLVDFAEVYLKNYKLNVYVPPSNITSEEGIETLKEAAKDIKIVSASYDAGAECESYVQEIEIGEDGIYNLPRITFEFEYTEESKWDILSGINLMGYVSHFVHPDDILDSNRSSGKTWADLGEEYYNMNKDIYDDFPWITPVTASEAAKKLAVYQRTNVRFEENNENINIYCDNYTDEVNLILRTNKSIGKLENCSVTKISEGAYLVIAKAAISKINLY